jgi:hypothetical protein
MIDHVEQRAISLKFNILWYLRICTRFFLFFEEKKGEISL